MKRGKYQYRKPRRQLHPLCEQTLKNHLHQLLQKKLSAMRDVFEKLPNRLECLDRQFVDDTFGHLSPAKRELLNLRLRPLEEALDRDITRTAKPRVVLTKGPAYYQEVLSAVILVLKAKRETQNQTLLSQRNIKRAIAECLSISRKKVNYNLTRFVENELMQQGIIEFWDESPDHTINRKTYRVNIDALDAV